MVTHLPRSRGRGRAARGGGTLDTSTVQGPSRVVCKRSAGRVTNDSGSVSCSWGGKRLEQPQRSDPSAGIVSPAEKQNGGISVTSCHSLKNKLCFSPIKRQFFCMLKTLNEKVSRFLTGRAALSAPLQGRGGSESCFCKLLFWGREAAFVWTKWPKVRA